MEQLLALDAILSRKLILPRGSAWWPLARVLAHLGDGPNVFGVLLLTALLSWFWQDLRLLWSVFIIGLIVFVTLLLVTGIKFFIKRQRPQPPGEFVVFQYDAYSFPSGHSARMAALAVGAIFFYPALGWILFGLTLGVAIARIVVGIHYLSDVLVGLGVGIIVAWIGVTLSWPIF